MHPLPRDDVDDLRNAGHTHAVCMTASSEGWSSESARPTKACVTELDDEYGHVVLEPTVADRRGYVDLTAVRS